MKKNGLRNLLLVAVAAVGVTAVTVYSCEKETITPNDTERKVTVDLNEGDIEEVDFQLPDMVNVCGSMTKKPILNIQGRAVGQAYIYNDKHNAHVILKADKGYLFKDAYLDYQAEQGLFVVSRDGGPDYLNFRYKIEGKRLSNVRAFQIPKADLKGMQYFACVAQVRTSRGGDPMEIEKNRSWVEGAEYGAKQKGMIFKYALQLCSETNATEPVKPSTGGKGTTTVQPVNE